MNPSQIPNFLGLILVLFSSVGARGDEKCRNTPYIPEFLASNTPYRAVANYNASEIQYDGCQATKLWALVRHGTRNPSVEVIEQMGTRLPEIRDQILKNFRVKKSVLRSSDSNAFTSWTNTVEVDDQKKLADEGKEEILHLADRLQTRFPGVLDSIYSESSYRFKYTDTKRTKKSAKYFTIGLFGSEAAENVDFPEPLEEDPILRFYKLCTKWLTEIDGNPDALIEKSTFEKSDAVLATVKEVNERLGFGSDELSLSDLSTMYLACGFETAWNQKRSPWCSVFSAANFEVMEYVEDLESYWVDGYGYELNYKQACPAFKDMVDFFQGEESQPKATVYFTHSGTLSKMLAHFGLYKDDEALTAANFLEQGERKWRTDNIDSFATNLVFVSFDCQGQQKILTLHQEEVVRLPSCPQDDLCGIERIVQYYNGSIPCLFDEMCENSS